MSQPSVLCTASSRELAEQIIDRLGAADVPLADTSVLVMPREGERPEPIKGLGYSDANQPATAQTPVEDSTTAAGAATGGIAGAAAGVATMSIVGLTPLLMIAPVVVATGGLIGAATTAAAVAATNGLSDYGIAPSRLEHYQQKLNAGDYLVAVRTDDEARLERAQQVFEQCGGQDIELFRLTKKLT